MTTAATIAAKLILESDEFNTGLETASGRSSSFTSKLAGIGGKVAMLGVTMAAVGAVAVGGFLADSAKSAMESENAAAELNAVLESTHGIAGMTADALNEQADALQKLTKFSDEQISSGQSMLLTFTGIGKDVFPEATVAMTNMAEKFGSMEGASTMLGKALNDPIAGVSALRRVGVALTEQQEAQIKAFVAAGDMASAQRVILSELETEFGGLAEAAGATTQGAMIRLANAFDEIKEKVGGALLPLMNSLITNVLMPMLPTVEKLAAGFAVFIGDLAAGKGPVAELLSSFSGMGAQFQPIIDAVTGLGNAFRDSLPMMQILTADTTSFIKDQFSILGPELLSNIATTLNQLADFWKAHGDEIMGVVSFAFKFIVTTVGAGLTMASGLITAITMAMNGDFVGAGKAWLSSMGTALKAILSLFGVNLDSIRDKWNSAWLSAKNTLTLTLGAISTFISGKIAAIKTVIDGVVGRITTLAESFKGLFNWLTSHVFNFKIELPKLPDWAIPGSPTPFEIGLRGMADAMKVLSGTPGFSAPQGAMTPTFTPALATSGAGLSGTGNNSRQTIDLNLNLMGQFNEGDREWLKPVVVKILADVLGNEIKI